jgi:hypothetical protein
VTASLRAFVTEVGMVQRQKDREVVRRADHKPPVPWDENLEALVDEWKRRAWAAQTAHYRRATKLSRMHVTFGVPVVILSTVVGTSLFATLNEENLNLAVRIAVGSVSVGAAVLAAIQTFFRFAQRADRHVLAADWYAAIRRRIEETLAMPPKMRDDARKVIDGLRKELNSVSSQFPQIGQREWARAAAEFEITEPPPGRSSEPLAPGPVP